MPYALLVAPAFLEAVQPLAISRHPCCVSEMFVEVEDRGFGLYVWSSYHPLVTPQIAGVCRSLGGNGARSLGTGWFPYPCGRSSAPVARAEITDAASWPSLGALLG